LIQEKQRKRKKLKVIKNKNRLIQQEEDSKKVQQTWKKFVDKGTKRSITGITKKSMFESSEDIFAKVGVTGSGRGMTTFQERKKHKFDSVGDGEDD
jgi:survival of motor neuron-related-splicing factor 30